MTTTELMVIVGGGAVGYWLVAVMWPNLRNGGRTAPPPVPQAQALMWHVELGVASDASRDQIEAAYRAKKAEYDPARVAHLAPDIREHSQYRNEQLDLAYDAALRDLEWLRPRGREV
jgi:preprotein translocase subunit Sec63